MRTVFQYLSLLCRNIWPHAKPPRLSSKSRTIVNAYMEVWSRKFNFLWVITYMTQKHLLCLLCEAVLPPTLLPQYLLSRLLTFSPKLQQKPRKICVQSKCLWVCKMKPEAWLSNVCGYWDSLPSKALIHMSPRSQVTVTERGGNSKSKQ